MSLSCLAASLIIFEKGLSTLLAAIEDCRVPPELLTHLLKLALGASQAAASFSV